jgi:hypothetical protein
MASSNHKNGTTPDFLDTLSSQPLRQRGRSPSPLVTAAITVAAQNIVSLSNGAYSHGHPQGQAIFDTPPNRTSTHTPTWNPAALLNPRGAPAVPKVHKPRSSISSSGTSDSSVIFQYATTTSHDGPSGSSAPIPQSESPYTQPASDPRLAANGMGGYIERMNNLQDRVATPPQVKRRKIESPENETQTKQMMGMRGSGIIGEYMKVEREEGKNYSPAPQSQTVDLTEGMLETRAPLLVTFS